MKRYFFFSLLFFLIFTVIWKIGSFTNTHKSNTLRFKKELLKIDNSFHRVSGSLLKAIDIDSLLSWENISSLINEKKIGVTIFNKDSLIYWNSNRLNPSDIVSVADGKTCLLYFNNTWYYAFSEKNGKWRVILYNAIEKNLADYIITSSSDDNSSNGAHFDSCFNSKSLPEVKNQYDSLNGKKISVDLNNTGFFRAHLYLLLFIFWLGGFVVIELLVIRLHHLMFSNKHALIRFLFLFIDITFLFVLISLWGIPTFLMNSFWFEKWYQIAPFIDSRGLAFLFVSFIIVLSIEFNKIGSPKKSIKTNYLNISIIALYNFLLIFFLLSIFNTFYIKTLMNNDNAIGFIFRHDLLELYFISGVVISIFFFQRALLRLAPFSKRFVLQYSALITIFSMAAFLLTSLPILFFVALFSTLIFYVFIVYYTPKQGANMFLRYLLLTVLFAIGFSIIINDNYSRLVNNFHRQLVTKLASNRSPYVEDNFHKVKDEIVNANILSFINNDSANDDTIINFLNDNYFKDLFQGYDVQLTICREHDLLQINPSGNLIGCKAYFNNLKQEEGAKFIDSSLMLLNQSAESRYYLGEIPLWSDTSGVTTLFVELFSSVVPSGLGYPYLFTDKRNEVDLTGYSIAKFHHNMLVYKMGDYGFHRSYLFMQPYPNGQFYLLNGYYHYKIRLDNTDILIVSRPARTLAEKMATFSMLFLLFSFLAIILYFITIGGKERSKLQYSFQTRLQVFIMATLVLLFLFLSIVSAYYFRDIRKTFIVNQLNEKTNSVLTELQDKFNDSDFTTEIDKEYLEEQLEKFSIVFFSDINIYNRSGDLIATSRPKIFKTGLLSTLINPDSYHQIMINKKLFYLTIEKIGQVTFYSAYVPLSFESGSPVGILNLPYFAHQSEVKKSYMPLLYNYLNIFVIIGVLGAFIALLIAKLLTRPLTMLQQSLSKIRIDKKNEPLVWKNDDEIGHLIAEYNLMVNKLEASAELLKRSEREMTWREVAQQVAHEIRNPLTPMKLNIQYLQRVYEESNDRFNEKWNALSASLIDQIDALNEVATTFSELAGNNTIEKEKIDLIQLLISAIDLYENNEKVSIEFETTLTNAFVFARQNELLRVFNNLIKNAVQSVLPEGGKVKIVVTKQRDKFEIAIIDNGRGIPNIMKERIFQPYFTTKSSGTGIGLAIVKNIITDMGGEISFVSEENKGSKFIVRLNTVE